MMLRMLPAGVPAKPCPLEKYVRLFGGLEDQINQIVTLFFLCSPENEVGGEQEALYFQSLKPAKNNHVLRRVPV